MEMTRKYRIKSSSMTLCFLKIFKILNMTLCGFLKF